MKGFPVSILVLLAALSGLSADVGPLNQKGLPVVLWHGMGDTCCGRSSVGFIKKHLEDKYGLFVYSIGFGPSVTDFASGYIGSVNNQVAIVCKKIKEIPELAGGYNAVGFSQGGQFLRAVAQRCNHEAPKMVNLITLAGQHQGVIAMPGCDIMQDTSIYCRILHKAIQTGVYLPGIQENIVQAQYFKIMNYLENSQFLADVNNEYAQKNLLYKQNLISLEKFVMIKFHDDEMVIPKESAWFGFFNGSHVIDMEDQEMYKADWLGLKTMNENGQLVFIECLTEHLGFSLDWLHEKIIVPFLLDRPLPA